MSVSRKAELELCQIFAPGSMSLPVFYVSQETLYEVSRIIGPLLTGEDYVDFMRIVRKSPRIYLDNELTVCAKPLVLTAVLMSVPKVKYRKAGLNILADILTLNEQYDKRFRKLWPSKRKDLQLYTEDNKQLWSEYVDALNSMINPRPCNTGVNSENGADAS